MAEPAVADLTFGLPIHYKGDKISSHSTNLVSAMQNPEVGDLNIEKLELVVGRLVGPSALPPFSTFQVSPLIFALMLEFPSHQRKLVAPPLLFRLQECNWIPFMLEARLPADKTLICKDPILNFRKRKKTTLRELQSLVGLLNFACSVI